MCGRFTRSRSWGELARLYGLAAADPPFAVAPRWNVAPGEAIVIVRRPSAGGEPAPRLARWGLIPSWAKDQAIAARTINARAETVDRLPSFRAAFRKRRCLVAADGFYEWRPLPGRRKQPYLIGLADGRPFVFAGLWERWQPLPPAADAPAIDSCTIIVTAANAFLEPLHRRMPVILDPEQAEAWLDIDRPPAAALALLAPYCGPMTVWPVPTRVNSVRFDDPSCAAPIGPAVTGRGDGPPALPPSGGDLFDS